MVKCSKGYGKILKNDAVDHDNLKALGKKLKGLEDTNSKLDEFYGHRVVSVLKCQNDHLLVVRYGHIAS